MPVKNSLEELMTHATIDFAEPITLQELEGLFMFVSSDQGLRFNYRVREARQITVETSSLYQPSIVLGLEVSGTVHSEEHILRSAGFSTKSANLGHEERTPKIAGIRFSTIPDYELHEHNPSEVKLWGAIRSLVEKYFAQRSKLELD